jgi:polar amino acid transport system permease protein
MSDWLLLDSYRSEILRGLGFTIAICCSGAAIGFVLGSLIALLQLAGPRFVKRACTVYVEIIRGTPLLLQLFILYYAGPQIGLVLSAITVGVVGLGIYSSAYFSEVIRGGFAAFPKGQIEAAEIAGFGRLTIIWRIMVPQMALMLLPAIVNLLIVIFKESAILSVITVPEMTTAFTRMMTETFQVVVPYACLALLYWGMIEALSYGGARLERALSRHKVRGAIT